MTKKIHLLLGLILMFNAVISAQIFGGDAASFEDATTIAGSTVWESTVKGTGTAEYSNDAIVLGTYSIKGANPGTSGNQMRFASKGTPNLNFTEGVTYLFKYKRFLAEGTDLAGGDKFYLGANVTQVNNTTNLLDPSNNCNSFSGNPIGEWYAMEFAWTADKDYVDTYIQLQVNPKAGTFYYDDFSIEVKPYEPSVVFNITREGSVDENLWITLEGSSPFKAVKNAKGSGDISSTTFTGMSEGTYYYSITGKGVNMNSGTVTVPSDADAIVDISVSDYEDVAGTFTFYPCYISDDAQRNGDDRSTHRAATSFQLTTGDDVTNVVYAYEGTGFWVGNVNLDGASAGQLYTYRMEYEGSLINVDDDDDSKDIFHPNLDSEPAIQDLKPREGIINITEAESANSTGLFKYFGWFDTYFVVKNEDGEVIDATITISNGGITGASTGADGIYSAPLKDDGTEYSYTVSATGYFSVSGTVQQVDADVTRDIIEEVELVVDGSTAVGNTDDLEFKVYPNPASGIVYVKATEGSQISLVSLTGAKVRSLTAVSSVSIISVGNLARGIYLVEVINGNNKIVEKVQVK